MEELCFGCFNMKKGPGVCPRCGYDSHEDVEKFPNAIRVGEILNDRYIVGRVLGQGGFGVTYVAQDFATRRKVAIKEFLPSAIAGRDVTGQVRSHNSQMTESFEQGKDSFMDEANALVEFRDNTHIVNVLDFFEQNGTAYFVMEFVQGRSLKEYVKIMGGKLGEEEANRILLPIMEALEEVHAKGLIHRDIAPDNIIVTADGSAKLIDFGAARYSTGEKSMSLDVVLKHGYAPVEQYTRRGRQGPYTDVYAMAATYYYTVTGIVPPDSIERMVDDDLPVPSVMGIDLTANTEKAILKGMEVQQANRYKTVGELLRDIGVAELQTNSLNASVSGLSEPLLAKAALYLKDRKWEHAEKCCDLVLDEDGDNREAKRLKEMAQRGKLEEVSTDEAVFSDNTSGHGDRDVQANPKKDAKDEGKRVPTPGLKQNIPAAKPETTASAPERRYDVPMPGLKTDQPPDGKRPPCAFSGDYKSLTIRGNGKMEDIIPGYKDARPWSRYKGRIERVIIEQGVTSIGDSAFENFRKLSSIELPEGMVSIGDCAFYGCENLKSITLPESIKSIGRLAFCSCRNLNTVTLPKGLETISSRAFFSCRHLENIEVPEGIKELAEDAFANCDSLNR